MTDASADPARENAPPAADPRAAEAGAPLLLAHTDWLHHRLTLSGPDDAIAAFRTRAAGAGVIPWQLDLDRMAEDWFHRLLAPPPGQPRTMGAVGARILTGQLRDAVELRHQVAASHVGRSRACRFDLHALLPVPDAILRLGPDHPRALAWLWQHWGTTQALRHVAEDPGQSRRPARVAGQGAWPLSFWSADWTPWRALARLAEGWPALHFDVRPTYDEAS